MAAAGYTRLPFVKMLQEHCEQEPFQAHDSVSHGLWGSSHRSLDMLLLPRQDLSVHRIVQWRFSVSQQGDELLDCTMKFEGTMLDLHACMGGKEGAAKEGPALTDTKSPDPIHCALCSMWKVVLVPGLLQKVPF